MSKCKIICMAMRKDELGPNKDTREWEVDNQGRVWPCCYYANSVLGTPDMKEFSKKEDPRFWEMWAAEPDFNDLKKYSLEEIIEHPIYDEFIAPRGWESNNPPELCVLECSAVIDEVTGVEQSAAKINVEMKNETVEK